MRDKVSPAGAGRAKHRHAAGHGLEDDEAEAFRDRGQRDEIALLQVGGELGVGESTADLDVDGLESADEVAVDGGTRVENEFGGTFGERGHGPEEIAGAFTLGERADEADGERLGGGRDGPRGEQVEVDAIADDMSRNLRASVGERVLGERAGADHGVGHRIGLVIMREERRHLGLLHE